MEKSGSDRKIYLEVLRIVACFFVIFNHTQNNGYDLYTQCAFSQPVFWIYLSVSIICKVAVPLFFMISGALLLDRDESLKDLYRKRVLRYFIVLLFFSAVYYLIDYITEKETALNPGRFLLRLYESEWSYSFWFLYAYLAYLIALPLLRSFARGLSDRNYLYLLILTFIMNGARPVVEYLISGGSHTINQNFDFSWLGASIVLYPLLGYYLAHRAPLCDGRRLAFLWGLSLLLLSLSCYATYLKALADGYMSDNVSQTFFMSFVMVYSSAFFMSARSLCDRIKIRAACRTVILSVSSATFGIYLLHLIVLSKNPWFDHVWSFLHKTIHLNFMLSAFVAVFLVMIICYVLTLILKRIPLIRRLL